MTDKADKLGYIRQQDNVTKANAITSKQTQLNTNHWHWQ